MFTSLLWYDIVFYGITITFSNLQNLGLGSMLRFSVGHLAIPIAYNSVTSVWYDANWNYQTYGENRAAITAISYSTSQSRYGTIIRYMKH